jgi:predicted nucleic acid-binding protein
MKFWDSSALVPLLVSQNLSKKTGSLLKRDPEQLVWWASPVECVSAVSRLEREGALSMKQTGQALQRLKVLAASWNQINPITGIKDTAIRLLRTHSLRAADALQLAAAFHASEGKPDTLEFVCFDERLAEAAEREGFGLVF